PAAARYRTVTSPARRPRRVRPSAPCRDRPRRRPAGNRRRARSTARRYRMRVDRTSGTRPGILDILSTRRQALRRATAATALASPMNRTSRAAAQDATTVTWFAGRDTSGYTPTQVEAFTAEHSDIQIDYQEQGAVTTDLHDK